MQDETGFQMIKVYDCVDEFGALLLDGTHQRTIVTANNLRGYHANFMCEYSYKECLPPKLILNGAAIMSMKLEAAKIKFCELLNILPLSLKA